MKSKKILVAAMCLNMCLAFTACGGKEKDTEKKDSPSTTETVTTTEEQSSDKTEAATESDANVVKPLWKANVPDTLKENEDVASEGDGYSYSIFEVLNGEDVERSITISIAEEETINYRKEIISMGIDLKDYADGKTDKVSIGGMDFVKAEIEEWGVTSTVYLSRYEGSQTSVAISIYGDADSEDIKTVLDTIEFSLPGGSETDAPYPWDGEPLVTETGSAQAGSYKLTAKQVTANESVLPNDIFDNRVTVVGDIMYALGDHHLYIFKLNGTSAECQQTIEMEGDYDTMSVDENGNVYISAFMKPLLVYNNGQQVTAPAIDTQFTVSPDGSFGIEYFTSVDSVKKITINEDGTTTSEDFPISGDMVSIISEVFITKDYILVDGGEVETNNNKIFVYDHNGQYIRSLADVDGDTLGSITGAVQTDNGILAIDGNMREVVLWDNDGNCLGEIDDNTLFGTDYPWISGICRTSDGAIYISMVEERFDKSWDEMIFFQIDTDF